MRALRARVAVIEDASGPVPAATVTIDMRHGRSLSQHFRAGAASRSAAMSDAELDAKVARVGRLGARRS
jgi:hypothetical protein